MNPIVPSRRDFLKGAAAAAAAGVVPMSFVKLAFADPAQDFTFAYISDAHIQHISGNKFVRNWDRGLIRAVAETNLLTPKPDFVMFGGDLGQLGTKAELDHGAEIMSKLRYKTHYVMGEHDYYLDLGEYWSKLFGPHWYSFDHKGVHFVVLNSILTHDDWTFNRWPSAEQRMLEMAGLDNPNGSPFMVGEKQRAWLKADLDKVAKTTPVVVFSHSPLQKLYKGWNFWTDDAEEVQAILAPFDKVNVIYGHVHQIQYNQIGNISFNAVMATAWPWPYPNSLRPGPARDARAHRAHEPRRPLLRARRHRLAVRRRAHRPGGPEVQPLQQHLPHRGLEPRHRQARGHRLPGPREAHPAAGPLLEEEWP